MLGKSRLYQLYPHQVLLDFQKSVHTSMAEIQFVLLLALLCVSCVGATPVLELLYEDVKPNDTLYTGSAL